MSGETELKPCPLCAGECSIGHIKWTKDAYRESMPKLGRTEAFYGHCMHCGFVDNPLGVGFATKQEAVKSVNRRATPPGYEMVPEGTRNILQRFANAAYNIKQNPTIPQDWRDSLSGLQAEADKVLQAIAASKRKDKEPT